MKTKEIHDGTKRILKGSYRQKPPVPKIHHLPQPELYGLIKHFSPSLIKCCELLQCVTEIQFVLANDECDYRRNSGEPQC